MRMILGKKLNMTQTHAANGTVVPVTIVRAGPCVVSQVKSKERDGYDAVQLCFGEKKSARKPQKQHVAGLPGISARSGAANVKEMRLKNPLEGATRGSLITVANFAVGDHVSVTGRSKGRGFAGVVKRHHFHGHPKTHGHKDQERMPGSIGAGGVQHVFKGQRMAGRMGNDRVTVHGLEIVAVDSEKNHLHIKGALPGSMNGFVTVVSKEGELKFEESTEHAAEFTPEQDTGQVSEASQEEI